MVKVQIDYLDLAHHVSVKGVSLTDFKHGRTPVIKECWLVDECFILVLESGDQICVGKSQANYWTTLYPINWLNDEQSLPLEDQIDIARARKAVVLGKKK
jgi:hypothetical protein